MARLEIHGHIAGNSCSKNLFSNLNRRLFVSAYFFSKKKKQQQQQQNKAYIHLVNTGFIQ
jgi:hypothetical protein